MIAASYSLLLFQTWHHQTTDNVKDYPWMGARARLKASFNCNAKMSTNASRIICTAMKKYGMILADNGE